MSVILVTGASSGFGVMIKAALEGGGHEVYGTSRTPAPGSDLVALDVTDANSVRACVEGIVQKAGRIDVLINNAGSGLSGAVEDSSDAEISWQMETNFMGPVRMIKAVLPHMRAQSAGRIITIGSLAGHAALPYQPIYSASKHALEGLNSALRLELRGTPIQATLVCPGDFATGFTAARQFAAGAGSAAHGPLFKTTMAIYERDEKGGADPALVGKLVAKLVTAKKLKPNYFAGPAHQTAGVKLKRLLPAAWFENIMAAIYKLP